ncbi:MAG: YafY family protein [Terracidiphilus sp.]|nr:YafY family protein [Terracidiphilus sp.]
MRRADRLFQIVQHLKARRLTTAAQLAQLLHVSERTIYRDIRDLSLSRIPILGEAGVGYSLDRSFELAALMFTPDEIEAVVVGLRMVRAFGGERLSQAARPALDKVILALPKERRSEVDRPQIYAPPIGKHRHLEPLMDQLRIAINERQLLRITYADSAGSPSRRTLRPLALNFWGATWTLAAWCELRRDFRSFRLDRIRKTALTGESFQPETGKTLDDFLAAIRAKGHHIDVR